MTGTWFKSRLWPMFGGLEGSCNLSIGRHWCHPTRPGRAGSVANENADANLSRYVTPAETVLQQPELPIEERTASMLISAPSSSTIRTASFSPIEGLLLVRVGTSLETHAPA